MACTVAAVGVVAVVNEPVGTGGFGAIGVFVFEAVTVVVMV